MVHPQLNRFVYNIRGRTKNQAINTHQMVESISIHANAQIEEFMRGIAHASQNSG